MAIVSNIHFNVSYESLTLTLPSLGLPESYVLPAFMIGTVTYLFILFCNLMIVLVIALNRHLHKPMYILLVNLPINDIMGATAFFPQLISTILSQSTSIPYPACFLQALLIHLYGAGALLILTAMAYDRYIAICWPLKYNAIMTNSNLMRIIIMVWLMDFSLIITLFALLSRFKVCRADIEDLYCNNPSLVKLICEDTSANNHYGLFLTAFLQGLSLLIIAFTYIHILYTCVRNKSPDARSKALHTCCTHLVVFLFLEFNACFSLIAHRFKQVSPSIRRPFGVSVLVFPPILNPLIYGLKTKEIRKMLLSSIKR